MVRYSIAEQVTLVLARPTVRKPSTRYVKGERR